MGGLRNKELLVVAERRRRELAIAHLCHGFIVLALIQSVRDHVFQIAKVARVRVARGMAGGDDTLLKKR